MNYNEDDFIKVATGIDSEFDRLLKKTWDEAKQFDVFRYNVDEGSILSRIIPGKFGFVAQFNKQRGSLRRKPQSSSALKMPFQPDLFNFTKAKPEEVLFTLKIDGASTETSILINNSPIEYCSSLMVPDLRSCLPQVFTTDALFQAICLIALSAQKSLRMGFNSLGAAASVNHLHMHLYYFDFDLEIENFETSGDSFLEDWPIKGIMFVIEELNIKKFKEVADCVSRLVEKCYQMNIAHNLFLTRNRCGNAIKVILWPRKPEFGSKNDMDLAAAMCEFSGFFICKTEECYTTLSEEMCIDLIKSVDVVSGNVKVEFSQILDSQSFGN